jgi:ATP-binding protein involved in chromosome partitioning
MSGTLDRKVIEGILAKFPDPETGRNLVQMEQVANIQCDAKRIAVTIGLTTYSAPLWNETRTAVADAIRQELKSQSGADDVEVDVKIETIDRPPQPLGQIGVTAKSVIAVGSGKGGVGKSTVAVALACGLKRAGCVVGLMDADVYGPSVPHLLGLEGRPEMLDGKIQPVMKDGMPVISTAFFLDAPDRPIAWRGPMLHGAITQFLRDTAWGNLDFLIIDMPPGTGDIAITLSQLLPLTGAVVVCTPQDVALLDAVKAVNMFRTVKIPLLGMVENMSGFMCPDCNKRYDIFGSGGAERRANEMGVPFLGAVPIQLGIREHGDAGEMDQVYDDQASAKVFEPICYQLVKSLADTNAANPPLPSLTVL